MPRRQSHTHRQIKQTPIDQFKQQWHEQLQQSNKGLIYNSFKQVHRFEHYLNSLSQSDSMNILRYRTANHCLPVETGRYDATPFHDRTCPLSESGDIGKEEHYLLFCSFFQADRLNLLNVQTPNPTSSKSLDYFLSEAPVKMLKNVSKLVSIIMRQFRN